MKQGKVSNTILKRSVLKNIRGRGEVLEKKPSIGSDCALLNYSGTSKILVSSETGMWAVYKVTNNISAKGGKIEAVQCMITLPEEFEEPELRNLIIEIESQCEKIGAVISGGHTQVSKDVLKPVINITGIGFDLGYSNQPKAKPGQSIIVAGAAGVSGIRYIASSNIEKIRQRFTQDVYDKAIGCVDELIGQNICDIAFGHGASYIHDISTGGIWTALWDMAEHSGIGIDVDLRKIPVRQEIIEVCEIFDINPYELESVGGMLIISDEPDIILNKLKASGVCADIIGVITSGNKKIIRNKEEIRYLDLPKPDEIERFI